MKLIVVEDFAFPLEESFSIWVLEPAGKVEKVYWDRNDRNEPAWNIPDTEPLVVLEKQSVDEWVLRFVVFKFLETPSRGLFLERSVNFSIPNSNFKIKTCWIVAQFIAHKPVNFASLTDSFIVSFSKLLKLWFWMQTRQTLNIFPGPKSYRYFGETGPRFLQSLVFCESKKEDPGGESWP